MRTLKAVEHGEYSADRLFQFIMEKFKLDNYLQIAIFLSVTKERLSKARYGRIKLSSNTMRIINNKTKISMEELNKILGPESAYKKDAKLVNYKLKTVKKDGSMLMEDLPTQIYRVGRRSSF